MSVELWSCGGAADKAMNKDSLSLDWAYILT